ncbi:Cupin domain-containing protein [Mycolicibacterium rutilum]|uniref:Cupin domain-containing protein n=1 Tax=Mycolicibacterium rutilum TaxID=370526 RepID=A0A1H6IIC8_MYCRU|nr:cupin domain-containing protein [Mycolicibacterium rutilum]SEH48618.1 Cupin domain-containing protein [Mycolicibacterium rutilum]
MISIEPCDKPQNLLVTPLHLGPGSQVRTVRGFAWRPEALAAYSTATADDGTDGRLMVVIEDEGRGDHWERHRADEVIVCLTGQVSVLRSPNGSDDNADEVLLGPGDAVVNPAGTWHAVDMHGRARVLTITPGPGSEHRPRA